MESKGRLGLDLVIGMTMSTLSAFCEASGMPWASVNRIVKQVDVKAYKV